MINILIVGDEPIVQKGLHLRLEAEADFRVIGDATNWRSALEQTIRFNPDVVIVDIDMRQLDGLELANALNRQCPQTAVILLSLQDDVHTCTRANQVGAAAFVVKSMPANTLLTAIRRVARRVSRNAIEK